MPATSQGSARKPTRNLQLPANAVVIDLSQNYQEPFLGQEPRAQHASATPQPSRGLKRQPPSDPLQNSRRQPLVPPASASTPTNMLAPYTTTANIPQATSLSNDRQKPPNLCSSNHTPQDTHDLTSSQKYRQQTSSSSLLSAATQQILNVLPDAAPKHVQERLQESALQLGERANSNQLAEIVIDQMIQDGYPTETNATKSIPAATPLVVLGTPDMDFLSVKSFQPSMRHVQQALQCLIQEFVFLAKPPLKCYLTSQQGHFAIVHDKIVTAIKGTAFDAKKETLEEAQYRRLENVLTTGVLDPHAMNNVKALLGDRACLQRPRQVPRLGLTMTEPMLQQEHRFAHARMKNFLQTMRNKRMRQARAQQAVTTHSAMPCQCCYYDVAIEDMIPCRGDGHLFCVECIQMQAKTKIFGEGNFGIDRFTKRPAMDLQCFHGDGCSATFLRSMLEKCLPEDYMKKYDEVQYHLTLDAAGLADVVECPKCGFKATLDPSAKVFRCPVDVCSFDSCRECGEAAHIPLRCDEVEKEVETKGRVSVEEAISQAKIRKCPKCNKGFIKEDGCNKMRCACGALVCYICRRQIRGYEHFCQTPHCTHTTCNKCPLWTKQEEDDLRAMREAGVQAAEKVQKESLASSDARHKKAPFEIHINVDDILRDPKR